MEKKTIGSFICVLRKANGMTQRELAEKLNVSDKAISRWERDEALPDLTLIPVLADIFGVTADELLRGQKATGEAPSPQAEEKSKKQLKYLLEKAKTDYRIRTLISVMLAIFGLIAAAILNLGALRAVAGFWVGCMLFLAAAVTQTIFKIQMDARLNTEEFDEAAIGDCKKDLLRLTMLSYGSMIVLFAFTLPLALVHSGVNIGLALEGWFPRGLVCAAVAGGAAFLVCLYIWLKKTGHSPKAKLLRKTLVITALVCVVTFLLQGVLDSVLYSNRHWFGTGTKFDSFEEFRDFIENPQYGTATVLEEEELDGEPWRRVYDIYKGGVGSYTQTVYATRGHWQGEICYYYRVNQDITLINFESDAIYTYTSKQSMQAVNAIDSIMACTMLLYPVEILAAALLYRRKAKKLP